MSHLGFLESEMRSVGSLVPETVASNTVVFNASGEQQVVQGNTAWAVVMFQGHLLDGGSGDSALAQLVDLASSTVYATLVLTQPGTFAIENQGHEFGPLIAPSQDVTLTCRVINATDADEVAVLANLQQAYTDPVA